MGFLSVIGATGGGGSNVGGCMYNDVEGTTIVPSGQLAFTNSEKDGRVSFSES